MTFLSTPIRTLEDGKRWLETLARSGRMFHLEDDPADIVRWRDGALLPVFSPDEWPDVRQRVAELYALDWGSTCPIGYFLDHQAEWQAP